MYSIHTVHVCTHTVNVHYNLVQYVQYVQYMYVYNVINNNHYKKNNIIIMLLMMKKLTLPKNYDYKIVRKQ